MSMLNYESRIPNLQLDASHPKRAFMRRALELEIRLSYYDRIMKTLPEPMQSLDAGVMPSEAPGYEYEYESSSQFNTRLQNFKLISESFSRQPTPLYGR